MQYFIALCHPTRLIMSPFLLTQKLSKLRLNSWAQITAGVVPKRRYEVVVEVRN